MKQWQGGLLMTLALVPVNLTLFLLREYIPSSFTDLPQVIFAFTLLVGTMTFYTYMHYPEKRYR